MSTGQLRKHEQFRSRFLRNRRDLIVYLPPGYEEQGARRFPVLYLQDGQNLFDGATAFIPGMDWHVGESANRLIASGAIQPLIIVGIYNAGKARVREYTPTRVPRLGGGRANVFAKFLVKEVMPFIQENYRTQSGPQSTGIGGSSLGALLSLYVGLQMPQTFGKIAALSPSIWWNQCVITRFAESSSIPAHPRIWLDVGTRESPRAVDDVEQFRDVLLKKGWRLEADLHYERIEGGEHNEAAWAQRVEPFLRFLFPAGETTI